MLECFVLVFLMSTSFSHFSVPTLEQLTTIEVIKQNLSLDTLPIHLREKMYDSALMEVVIIAVQEFKLCMFFHSSKALQSKEVVTVKLPSNAQGNLG